MRTTISEGPGFGSGTSSRRRTSGPPNSRTIIERMAGCYHERSRANPRGTSRNCNMSLLKLHKTVGVKVGRVQVGGGAPIVVQSMTMTDTADAPATAQQCIELA